MKYRKHLSISAIKNKINGKVSPYGLIKKFGKSWIRKISYLNSSAIMGNCKVTMIDCSVSSDMLESIRSKKNYHFRLSANLSNPSTSEKKLTINTSNQYSIVWESLQQSWGKVVLQLYWNRSSAWMFSCKFAAYFQNTFS